MRLKPVLSVILFGALAATAQTGAVTANAVSTEPGTASAVPAAAASETTIARPKSFDLSAMDKNANPCEDFYQYACGNWRKNNPIPADQARWGRFNELAEYNRQILHAILEKASASDPKRSPVMQKVGDMYQSCMDEAAVNAKGAAPVKPDLDRIAAIANKDQLVETVAYLHSLGVPALFQFGSAPDLHSAGMEMANVAQGGLGLPDRDYYLAQEAKSQETRQKYLEHMTNMFVLLGDNADAAKKEAQAVMAIETKLAMPLLSASKCATPRTATTR